MRQRRDAQGSGRRRLPTARGRHGRDGHAQPPAAERLRQRWDPFHQEGQEHQRGIADDGQRERRSGGRLYGGWRWAERFWATPARPGKGGGRPRQAGAGRPEAPEIQAHQRVLREGHDGADDEHGRQRAPQRRPATIGMGDQRAAAESRPAEQDGRRRADRQCLRARNA